MARKTKYVVFYVAGLAEWGVIFFFLRMLHISPLRLWVAYLLIAGISGVGSLGMYATERVDDSALRLRYRVYVSLGALVAVGACLCWAVGLFRTRPSLSADVPLGVTAAMLAGGSWLLYRAMTGRGFGDDHTSNDQEPRPR